MKMFRKGSVEVFAIILLLVIATITTIAVAKKTANSTLHINDKAQEVITF